MRVEDCAQARTLPVQIRTAIRLTWVIKKSGNYLPEIRPQIIRPARDKKEGVCDSLDKNPDRVVKIEANGKLQLPHSRSALQAGDLPVIAP